MNTGVLVVIGFILIVMILLISVSRDQHSQMEKTNRHASQLGFQPLEKAPPSLVSGIQSLYQQGDINLDQVRKVYHRRDFDTDYYFFGLDDDTEASESILSKENLGVLSADLALPRFYLASLPTEYQDGFMSRMLDKVLDKVFDWAAKQQGLTRMTFPKKYRFDKRFALFVGDELTARQFFSDRLLNSLTGIRSAVQVAGMGNLLTVSWLYPDQQKADPEQKRELFRVSQDLYRLFKRDTLS